MGDERDLGGVIGEPTPPLTVDPQTATLGTVLHIRLVGPAGGHATAEVVPLTPPPAEVAREGPVRG